MKENREWHNIKDNAIGELQKILKVDITCRADDNLYEIIKNKTFCLEEKNILVLWVQKRLKAMGYYHYYPTGIWEKNIMNSIYKLYKRHSLNRSSIENNTWYFFLRG